jgi:hypothetical protein
MTNKRAWDSNPEYYRLQIEAAKLLGIEDEETVKKAIEIQEALVSDFPANPEYLRELVGSYQRLGITLASSGLILKGDLLNKAEEAYLKALDLQAKLVADFPANGSGDGDWGTPGNWDPAGGPPGATGGAGGADADWAIINPGVGQGPTVNATENNAGGITILNGNLTVKNAAYVGCIRPFLIGLLAGHVGEVTVESGGHLTIGWDRAPSTYRGTFIGYRGTGMLNNWGTMNSKRYVSIGNETSGIGVVNMYDGVWKIMSTAGEPKLWWVGKHGEGTLNMYGGEILAKPRLNLGNYNDGNYTNSRGHIEMSGGRIVANHLYMEINAKTMQSPVPDFRGTIHQTAGEFIFDSANQKFALNRVRQAISNDWWTTDPGLALLVTDSTQSVDGFTHVTVVPETDG